jgi:acetyltransferase-like isoleucine patch superfamily enzyme
MALTRLKDYAQQVRLRRRFRGNNAIGPGVKFSEDTVIEGNAVVGAGVILGPGVRLGKNAKIGDGAILAHIIIGNNSCVELGVICTGNGSGIIRIGEECYIGIRNVLDWSADITIGNYVHIAGPGTGLWTHSSAGMCLNGIPLAQQSDRRYRPVDPVVVEDNTYIGGNCTIYPGVTVGHHSIVAPNSAVTKDTPPCSLVGGVPAKVIKKLPLKKT